MTVPDWLTFDATTSAISMSTIDVSLNTSEVTVEVETSLVYYPLVTAGTVTFKVVFTKTCE